MPTVSKAHHKYFQVADGPSFTLSLHVNTNFLLFADVMNYSVHHPCTEWLAGELLSSPSKARSVS